jgi:ribosomal protein L7/L12
MNYQLPLLIAVGLIVIIGASMAASASGKRAELERRLAVTERKLNQVLKKLALNGIEIIEPTQPQQAAPNQSQAARFEPRIEPAVDGSDMAVGLEVIQTYLRQGRKIQAIKAYRELTGVGLKEAKDAVERMEGPRRGGPSDV